MASLVDRLNSNSRLAKRRFSTLFEFGQTNCLLIRPVCAAHRLFHPKWNYHAVEGVRLSSMGIIAPTGQTISPTPWDSEAFQSMLIRLKQRLCLVFACSPTNSVRRGSDVINMPSRDHHCPAWPLLSGHLSQGVQNFQAVLADHRV
jgi:hypothetical protein